MSIWRALGRDCCAGALQWAIPGPVPRPSLTLVGRQHSSPTQARFSASGRFCGSFLSCVLVTLLTAIPLHVFSVVKIWLGGSPQLLLRGNLALHPQALGPGVVRL